MSALVLPTAFFLFSLLTSAASLSGGPLADERLERLSKERKSWLERDVLYILTQRAREAIERSLELDFEQPAVKARLTFCDSDTGAR